jgi:hypothetical protein
MTSPAKRHFERVSAANAAASAGPGESLKGASRYELMLVKLATDRRRLKELQSIARKVDVKREVLPEYGAYVDGALEGGRGAQDDVLTTIMIWRIDVGDYAGALTIARYALKHKMTLPEHYERTLPAAVAEEFAEAALATLRQGETFDVPSLVEVSELTAAADMHDPIRAKLYKAIGIAQMKAEELDVDRGEPMNYQRVLAAHEALRRALELDARSGVKQNIARLESTLSDAAGVAAGRT